MSTVQEALKAREERKKREQEKAKSNYQASNDRINSALESYKKRKQSNAQSALSDIAKRLNSEIEAAKNVSTPSWGEGSLKTFLESTRESRLNVGKLKREVESYKSYLDEETYNSLFSTVSKLGEGYNSYIRNAEVMEKFDSEDSYNKWYEEYKKQEDEKNAVLSAEDFDEYSNLGANVANPSWEAAHAPLDIGGWKPFGDGETINNMVTFAEAHGKDALRSSNQALADGGTSTYGEIVSLINDHMKDDEKAIYNYYVGKGDTEKANEYLTYITDILRQRQAGKIVEQVDNTALEAVFSLGAGTLGGITGLINVGKLVTGADPLPKSTMQYAHGSMSQNNEGVWKAANDLLYTTGNMTPSILAGTIAGPLAGPMVGKAVGSFVTTLSSAGNSYASMIEEGYGVDEARKYGVMVGITEGALSYAFSGISSIGGRVTGNIVSKVVDGIDNGIARFVADVALNMGSEALEEATQEVLDPVFKMIATGEDFEGIDWSNVAYSALLGGLSAGLLEGVPRGASAIHSNYQTNVQMGGLSNKGAVNAFFKGNENGTKGFKGVAEAYKSGKQTVNEMASTHVNEALEIDPDNKFAQKMQTRLDKGKNASGYQINRLIESNENALVSHDKGKMKSAAEARLTELGESGDVGKLANIIVKSQLGEKLTSSEKKALTESAYGEWVAEELNPDSVNKGFSEDYSNWAESIGTERINTEAYNRGITEANEVAEEPMKSNAVTENATSEENAAESEISASVTGEMAASKEENTKLVENIAADNVTRVKGFTNEAATAMIKGYDGSISPENYTVAFNYAFELGANGVPSSNLTRAINLGVSERVAFTAYELGRQSAENGESVLNSLSENGIINTNESEAKNESGENVHLRNVGKRDGGKNTQRQVSRVEGGTRQAESRGKASRIADSEAARIVNEGREVKVSDLGILGGSTEQTVRVVDKANETSSMKEARKRAEARGLKVTFFTGDNLVIKDKSGEWISARAYIKGEHVFVRADHSLYTADQLMRHELGHDMIAKGEVDIEAVRERLEETVGKENIDTVAKHYANAYAGTGMSADEIWEECICDSLGDMNIFAGNEAIGTFLDQMLPEISSAASESKSPTQTRGSPDGKASRETVPKRDKHLYASGVYFLHKNFPPENERLSEAHRLAVLWARNQNTVAGDQTLIFMNDVCYLVECFDDALNYYQVEDVISKAEFDNIYKEIKQYGRSGQIKSVQGSFDEYDKLYKSNNSSKTGKSSIDSNEARYGRENSKLVRVDSPENKRRERSSSDRGGDSQSSSENKQKYSRELDTEYLSAVNRGDMETAQRMVDEAAKEAGYTVRGLHATNAEFNAFDISKTSAENFHGKGIYFTNSVRDLENNYENYEGPDPWQKIEGRAYELAYDKYGISYEDTLTSDSEIIDKLNECYDIAIDEFKKSGRRITAYLRFDNPLILEKGMQIPYDYAGYDGIIDKQVYENIGHSGMDENTIHYVVFNPNNIKSADPVTYDDDGNVIPLSERFNPQNIDIRYSRELDFIDFINEQAGEESDPNLTKTQNVAKVRGELEKMNVGKGEVMAVMKLADKMFDLYGGDSSISDFRYGLFEATKLALNGSETGFEAAYDIIHTLASEVAYNPKDIGGDADVLAQIKKDIRGTKLAVHEKDKTSGEFDSYGGYGAFRKSHLGKFMLANDGVQVDAKYAELQNLYGESFFPDVNTVSEQLLQMAKLMDTPLSDYMMVTDKELQATADGMVQSLFAKLGDIWSRAIKSEKTIVAPVESDKFSNRSLLVGALETAVQNDIEKNKLEQYKEKIGLINSEEQKLLELRTKIKELSFAKGTRDTEAIKSLQLEANQAANRINTYDRQLLNLESTKALKGVLEREKAQARKRAEQKGKEALERYREKSAKTQRELMERYQESRKRGVESRNKTAMRYKIKEVVNDLNNYLLKGTKDKHVPIELQRAVAEALDAVNMDTVGAEERIAKKQAEMRVAKSLEEMQRLSKEIEHIQEMGGNMEAKISRLKTAYDSIINSDDPLVANSHDDVISSTIGNVMEYVGETPLRDMSLPQLEAVYDMYRMVLHSIRNANKAFKAKKSEEISVIANRVLEEIDKLGKKKALQTKAGQTVSEFDWNNQKPVYAFERIGSNSFTEVFNNVRAGEDTWAVDMTEAQKFLEDQKQNHKFDSWDFDKKYEFTSSTGKNFKLSLGQIMSLYAYSKRGDQAKDHLRNGGFVFDGLTEVKEKNKLGVTKTYQLKDATAYNLSDETLSDILSKLTPEQKAFADAMQDYLSTVMGEKGNEVSLELYGVKLFKEKNYFPLKSAPQYLERAREQAQGDTKIKNKGFTKETTPKAKNPIVLTSFMDVWAGHVNEMSMYHAFTLPLEDFYRVYNYKTPASETMDSESVISFLENAHGEASVSYIDQLLKDLNGGARSDPRESAAKALMSKFKKASVMASLSVVVQQPSAIVRAQALVDAKYFVGNKVSSTKHKETWAEVKKYAPVAVIKEMGYFDVGMGQSSVEWLKGEKTLMDKVDDALSKAPALADEFTWVAIWNAVKRETAHNNPNLKTSSEEFLKLAGERFTEVIVKTQVYDSTLARSANMRSKSAFMSMWTAFMAEPTTSINMLQDAFKKGNKKQIARTIGAVYGSVVLNAALVSLVYAMRDDDEDETFLEKYLSRLTTEVIDGINPLTYVPFVKDIWSALQGFDIERSDMTLITKVIDSLQQLVKVAAKDTSDMDDAELKEHRKAVSEAILSITDNLASLTGVPEMNIRRDINGIINGFKTIKADIEGRETTAGSLGDNILEDVKDTIPVWGWFPDEKKGDKLYDAIIKGDKAYEERLKSGYKNDTAINSAIRKALRENDPRIKMAAECLNAGDLRRRDVILDTIVAEGHFDEKLVGDAIRAEANAIKEESEGDSADSSDDDKDEAYSKYQANDINVAFESGDTALAKEIIQDLIDTKVANGMDEKKAKSSLRSSMTSYWKPLYKMANEGEKSRIRKILYNSGLYGTVNDVVKTAQDWLKD